MNLNQNPTSTPLNFQVHTFGCKVNTYDTGLIQKNLRNSDLKLDPNVKVHVLNTCAVTAEATKEAVRTIRRIKAKEPFATVVVTGCGAQVDTEAFRNLPGADLVIANSHKGLLPQILDQFYKGELKEKVFKSNIFRKEDLEMGGGEESTHTRSFLKIQDGCNSFCTYCVIPYARGKSRSLPVLELAKRINELSGQGVREVVLTGVHIGDYEFGLENLVEELLERTTMPRFRLSSLEPVEVTDRLLSLYKDPRLCPHFHMSIQSAETETLAQMKRKYTQADVQKALRNIKELIPRSFVGMDVITGFPTETEAQFEETFATLAELPWTKIHVFPYSERPGTRAATYTETVPWNERLKRAQKLRELSLHRYQSEALRQKDAAKDVLILNKASKGGAQSLSRDYWPVKIQGAVELPVGHEISVRITGYEHNPQQMEGVLLGERL
jgi:threonylcarbamoyladenosine tRNA methylthiotransferase MtaB